MLTFTEEIMLLLLDDDGEFAPVRQERLSCALAGAVLMDLAFALRIDTDTKKLVIIDPTPTGNPVLDLTLARIAGHEQESNTRTWIKLLSVEDATAIREQALQSLVARGILERRERKFPWVSRSRRYPMIDGMAEREVKLRIFEVLTSDAIPDPRDVALIGLVQACDLLDSIFSHKKVFEFRRRIAQLRKMDLISRDLAAAIIDIIHTDMRVRSGGH